MISFEYSGSPETVSWDVTLRCNLNCRHCYSFQSDDKTLINTNDMFKIIDILKGYGIFRVTLTGGEPLLRRDIFDIIKKLKSNRFTVEINTNGTLITEEKANRLKELGVDSVRISLDGSNARIHDEFRNVKGAFEGAISGIRWLNDKGIKTNIATVPNKFNKKDLNEMIKLLSQFEISEWHFFRLILTGRALNNKDIILNKDEYFRVMKDVYELSKVFKNINISFNDPLFYFNNNNTFGCGAGKVYMSLDTSGDFHLCPSNPHIVGNIFKDNLMDIWNNRIVYKLRENSLIKECTNCELRKVCGGCCASSFSKYGIDYIKDPYCIK